MRAPRNKTLTLTEEETETLSKRLLVPEQTPLTLETILNRTILGNAINILTLIPDHSFDLLVLDPPYNLSKNFHGLHFKAQKAQDYQAYLKTWLPEAIRKLKPFGSVYLCGDWRNTATLQEALSPHVTILNRISWQREKGRGAKKNWKNSMEDIWFGVKDAKNYYFCVDAVKHKKRVRAPYRHNGEPKDWQQTKEGKFRLSYPSNFWNDITVPYWSMPENTDHPTQKPEKLLAKIILASCPEGGLVLDPFLGSGTTSVVAKKLGRNYVGIECNMTYALWAQKRLHNADESSSIQGYVAEVFWERNTLTEQHVESKKSSG